MRDAPSLSLTLFPHTDHLTPSRVTFRRPESGAQPSMLAEGRMYRHPERHEEAIVWAKDTTGIVADLMYHYRRDWSDLRIVTPADHGA